MRIEYMVYRLVIATNLSTTELQQNRQYFEKRFLPAYSTYVNCIRNAKGFLSKLYQTVPYGSNITNDHSLCEENNQSRLFRSVFLNFLQNFFSTWKLLPESNSSPRERSNHTKIIKIHREPLKPLNLNHIPLSLPLCVQKSCSDSS